jgi:lysophospholipase L1-like esterase
LHGGGGKTAYRQGFPDLIATIKAGAPGAKLIWATTTPCRGEGGMTQNVREFNKIAAEFVEKEGIPVDDLYGLVMKNADNPKVLWDGGGIHFTEEGAALQGQQVAQSVLAVLPAQP